MRTVNLSVLFMLLALCGFAQKTPEAKAGWHLGAQSYTFRLFTLEESLRKVDSCGLRNVELYRGQKIGAGSDGTVHFSMSPADRALVKSLLKKYNVTARAFGVINGKDEDEWKQIFEFAKELGIGVINTEPSPDQFKYIIPMAAQYKIKVGLHNHPKPSRYWHPDTVQKYMGDSKWVGACVDIGHYVRSGLDPVAAMKQLDGRIVSFHFKDVVKDTPDGKYHDVIWGNGESKVVEVIKEMKRQKFQGPISAEYEHNWDRSSPEVAKSVIFFRETFKNTK